MLFKRRKLAELAGCPLVVLPLSMSAQLLCQVQWKTTRRCDDLTTTRTTRTTRLAENDATAGPKASPQLPPSLESNKMEKMFNC
jgi:hypothetical protein